MSAAGVEILDQPRVVEVEASAEPGWLAAGGTYSLHCASTGKPNVSR